jgi:oxygen-dependent protoporphyrinogen oxidase
MSRVVVVGGGISGLTAAHRIAIERPDVDVVLLEASGRTGGKLRRIHVGGAWVDVGAEAMLAVRPEGIASLKQAGLGQQMIHPLSISALLRNRGQNRPLPTRTLMGIPADLETIESADVLSDATLAQIAGEPGRGPYTRMVEDISVGELVAERFGPEVVERLVDPLLGGVYAGHAHSISVQAALPALAKRLMAQGESLLQAAAAVTSAAGRDRSTGPVFASISGGLAQLPEAIVNSGAFTVRTQATVRAVRRTQTGFALTLGAVPAAEELTADAVVLATPPGKTAALLDGIAPLAAGELASINTASMAIVTLAFTSLPADSLPAGSGILVPPVEGLDVKAMTFSSQKWPGVGADAGVTLLRASLGRAGEEWVLQREDADLVSTVRRELATVTGLVLDPIDTHVQRWGGGLPQYEVGHVQRVSRIRSAVAQVPGLAVCGATFDGVGIPACIASAHIAADRVLAGLTRPGESTHG